MNLNENERKVLAFLVDEDCGTHDDGGFCSFAPIIASTRLERPAVRRACRSLKRKGFVDFGSGLFTEDGEPAGSGYAFTPAGRSALEREGK